MVWLATGESRRGQLNHEAGTATIPRFITDSAIIHIQQAGRQKQPQPQPLPPGALRNKRLEEVSPDTFRHARPVVFYSDDYFVPRRALGVHAPPNHGLVPTFQCAQRIAQQPADNFADYMFGHIYARSFRNLLHQPHSLAFGQRP